MLSTPTEGKRRVWCQLVSLSRDTSLKGGRDSGGEGDRRWGARDAFEEVSDHLACVCVFQVVMMAIDVCAAEEEGLGDGGDGWVDITLGCSCPTSIPTSTCPSSSSNLDTLHLIMKVKEY